MLSSPQEVVSKLASSTAPGGEGYSVTAYYLNSELRDKERPERPYGFFVPCGTYPTLELAERARDRLSAESGAPGLAICPTRRPCKLLLIPDERTTVYSREVGSTIKDMEESIRRERQQRSEVQSRLNTEIKERDDPSTISHTINIIYNLVTADNQVNSLESDLQLARERRAEMLAQVSKHFTEYPLNASQWKSVAEQRLTERGESALYASLLNGMERITPELHPC